MHTLYFYFERRYLSRLLDCINTINTHFAKIFHIRFLGVDAKSTRELLEGMKDFHNWWMENVDGWWPHNEFKVWDDAFEVSLEISVRILHEMQLSESSVEFSEKLHTFCQDIMEMLPVQSITFWDGDSIFENKMNDGLKSSAWQYAFFWYFWRDKMIYYIPWGDEYFSRLFTTTTQFKKRFSEECKWDWLPKISIYKLHTVISK